MDEIEQVICRIDEDMRLRDRSDSVKNNYKQYAWWFLWQAGKPVADLTEADIRAYLQRLIADEFIRRFLLMEFFAFPIASCFPPTISC